MKFMDINAYPMKSFSSSSLSNDLNKKDHLRKLKRLNTSILNLFTRQRQTIHFERENTTEELQPRNSLLRPLSMMTASELSRSVSNKSITFALVFDELEKEIVNKDQQVTFHLDKSEENEDLVIVVPNKYVTNESEVNNSNTNKEPYPFRTEIPSCLLPKSKSSTNMSNSSYSKKKLLHHLIPYYRSKKVHHPVKTIQSINKIAQSNSTPNMLCSLSSTSTSLTTETKPTKDDHQPSKSFPQRFKLPSFNRFLRSFIKQPKEKSRLKSSTSRKYSEMIY